MALPPSSVPCQAVRLAVAWATLTRRCNGPAASVAFGKDLQQTMGVILRVALVKNGLRVDLEASVLIVLRKLSELCSCRQCM